MRILARGNILLSGGNLSRDDFDHSNLFSKLKTTFCKYCMLIKIKISMTYTGLQIWVGEQ